MIQVEESDVARVLDDLRDASLDRPDLLAYRGAISLAFRLDLISKDEWERRSEECRQLLEDAQ